MSIPVVILCGGQGTRMGDTLTKKELVEIGNRPLLWHVMRIFSAYGHNRFILALGHLGDHVRRYFLEYEAMTRDVTLTLARPSEKTTGRSLIGYGNLFDHPAWEVTMVDTGLQTEKASRIGQLRSYLANDERFFVAYGEAVADIDLSQLTAFHQAHGRLATVTGIQVDFQYGVIDAGQEGQVNGFTEKPRLPYWINGGFMLFERPVLDRIVNSREDVDLEREILPELAVENQLMLYRHHGYWQSMKTLKDALDLKKIWDDSAPWKVWS
ncbi:MAG: sugar phosphate nucleotidyltransferase [Ardenticatenaceae bacterium]|nr:sugar phosphate nucleotidyltransferase [Ardenticatenaceae bacterium]